MIWTLSVLLATTATFDSNDTIQKLRMSELKERLAQTEAKRLQLELQIAKAKHAIDELNPAPEEKSEIADELARYQLVGIVAIEDKTHVVLRKGDELIRLLNGVQGAMSLIAEVQPGKVRISRFGHFRDLPLTERW
jgi:chaperonin cofactor prefoldin